MALCFVLLVTAVLLMSSALRMGTEPLGFHPEGAVATHITLPMPAYAAPAQRIRFYNALLERLETVPRVLNAALADDFSFFSGGDSQYLETRRRLHNSGNEIHDVSDITISARFFDVLKIALRRGRAFDSRDSQDSQVVAIVSESLVREYFPDDDPLGQQIRLFRATRAHRGLRLLAS